MHKIICSLRKIKRPKALVHIPLLKGIMINIFDPFEGIIWIKNTEGINEGEQP